MQCTKTASHAFNCPVHTIPFTGEHHYNSLSLWRRHHVRTALQMTCNTQHHQWTIILKDTLNA